ncbi:MAG: T9SS type A sorting domain-containing protein [Bacteroidales bacterium]|nr:T9SS type A sorting domain-containing protein [Bacteroidales bacterium]
MKKIILIFLLTNSIAAFAQVNFPESNAIWNMVHYGPYYDPSPRGEMRLGLKGDTLINDTLYNKLYKLVDTTLAAEKLQSSNCIGGLRLEGQKVWFKPFYYDWTYSDILLYDFSASVGDTVWHRGGVVFPLDFQPCESPCIIYSVIQEINIINGIKTYSVIQDQGSNEWYEGIGSSLGLFGSVMMFALSGGSCNLACLKHNDTIKYLNNYMCDKCFCRYLSIIDDNSNNPDWINVYPNPTKNILSIEIQKRYSNILVEIIDMKGSVVYRKESLDSQIMLNNLIKGVYIVKLSIDNDVVTKKLVIE